AEGARARETAAVLAAIPEVLEVHRVVGEDCFFLKVRVGDTDALGRLLDETIQPLPSVASTRTTIVLSTAKELAGTGQIPSSSRLLDDDSTADSVHRAS
ncbi:MAG TPA: Lrp/AsnC ligand binding domain-containing protein, partial [Longimicrobiales bacterium]|nr:Lrp/AsnC ligand binding domain-containing protein [Longimicrobiales bacterium]